jgi:hypothetical protein
MGMSTDTATRLEYLRGELRAQRISWGELAELQSLAPYIEPGDVELAEPAGIPESEAYRTDIVWCNGHGVVPVQDAGGCRLCDE